MSSSGESSQPDLSNIGVTESDSSNISFRKKKVPADDFGFQFNQFKKEILSVLKDFGKVQTDNINTIKQDITLIKEQLADIKNTTDLLKLENKNCKLQIENLTTTVNNTQEKIKCLENDLHAIQISQLPTSLSEHPIRSNVCDVITTEIQERIERSKNIIIIGVIEPHEGDKIKRRETDKSEVKKIIQTICPLCPDPEKIIRLGKYDRNKTRPLKVCFSSQEIARTILKKKTMHTANKFKIYSDQTPSQRQVISKLKEELNERLEKGEKDLVIKYVKGNPKIIKWEPKN